MARCTAKGDEPTLPENAPTPTDETLPDGQKKDHWTMCPTEIMQAGLKRPVREQYKHVGIPGPQYPLRDLTAEEQERSPGNAKYEPYPEERRPALGRYWTQAQLDSIGKGCGTITRMPKLCAETYAANPGY